MEDDVIGSAGGSEQKFAITIAWSAESDVRLTEGDVSEALEGLVMDIDEDAVVDVAEILDAGD